MKQLSIIPFGNRTITLYNKAKIIDHAGKAITTWHRHNIPNCFITTSNKVINSSGTAITINAETVKIPLFSDFILPYEYSQLLEVERNSLFTVNVGDLIVIREVFDEIETDTQITSKYGTAAFKISSVKYNIDDGYPLKHISAVS